MSSREFILDRVRRNQPQPTALPDIPDFDRHVADPLAAFGAALARMGGTLVAAPADSTLNYCITGLFPQARVIVSATPEVLGTRALGAPAQPALLEDVDVGVVRAAFGVVETGSVWVSERELVVNAIAFLPQHLVVLLDPASLVPDLHHAYRDRRFQEARYAVLMTGPSATADIEGVLIRGAQGIRSLTVITTAAPSAPTVPSRRLP